MTEAERKEKMNELMNRISFELKDESLALGFEIICNRITDLEKENENLKKIVARYFIKIAEQEEEIDKKDDRIKFYESKLTEKK